MGRTRQPHADETLPRSRDGAQVSAWPDVPAPPRRIRIESLDAGEVSSPRPTATATANMASSAPHAKQESADDSAQRRHRHHHHRRRRGEMTPREEHDAAYDYESPPGRLRSSCRAREGGRDRDRDRGSDGSDEDAATQSGSVRERPRRRRTRGLDAAEEEARPRARRHTGDGQSRDQTRHVEDSGRGSRPHRSTSTRLPPTEPRQTHKRSNTLIPTTKPLHATAGSRANTNVKRAGFLEGLFGPAPPQHREPEKLVTCLTCLSDDIPRSKAARLKCGHRMCHSCLRRIFKLSVTDPQHMPPKCCTADHIPLKHVDRLFDNHFKKTWNRKFQEFSTKNRLYCPSRRCGEWIKPGDTYREQGRKCAKCSRCKTKVCGLCNGKWHGTKECPKDEETNQLLEAAKQAGWQRCYSCKAMVELKEGCNHMTCRCTAEFCMVCGLKWKTCECPWFNYETVEQDRLNHMRVPGDEEVEGLEERPFYPPHPQEYNYNVDFDLDHDRFRAERMARAQPPQYHAMTMRNDDHNDDDYQGGIGDILGIGNGAGHFMNDDYVQAPRNHAAAAANHAMDAARARPPHPPPSTPRRKAPRVLRRHTALEQAYNTAPSTRPEERVVPRRTRTDYESEAAVHAPPTRRRSRAGSASASSHPPSSVLAGLLGAVRGQARVGLWRSHVEPGAEPAEGVLSM